MKDIKFFAFSLVSKYLAIILYIICMVFIALDIIGFGLFFGVIAFFLFIASMVLEIIFIIKVLFFNSKIKNNCGED